LSYIDELASAIRHEIPPQLIPEADSTALFRIYAVLALAKGERVVIEDVHDAWSAWMSSHNPNHQSLKPLDELDEDIQRADEPYLDAIRKIARTRNIGRQVHGAPDRASRQAGGTGA
jgi:hypothetical protein